MGREIDEGEGRRITLRTRWPVLLVLLLSLLAAGCANNDAASDNDNRGVFYGGVTGGGSWP